MTNVLHLLCSVLSFPSILSRICPASEACEHCLFLCKQPALVPTKENGLCCTETGANTGTPQGQATGAVNFSHFSSVFLFHNASLMCHKRCNVFQVNFQGR